jgi:hypothetical protein
MPISVSGAVGTALAVAQKALRQRTFHPLSHQPAPTVAPRLRWRVPCSHSRCWEDNVMHKAFITEVGGQWVVMVEGNGHHQQYLCDTLQQAQRWLALLDAPVRQHPHHPVRARSEG